VVLLTADHGESLGEQGIFFAHGTHTRPDVSHVPLLLHAPGLTPARRDEIVHHVDVLPTLLDLAHLSVPDGVRGHRLGRLVRGDSELPDRVVFSDIGPELGAYHGERYVRIRSQADSRPAWSSHRWTAKGLGGRLPKDPELRRRILPYWQTQPHTNPSPLSSEERERLRAIGYLDPAEEILE
jgi:arylsulfatase A-like enzyme